MIHPDTPRDQHIRAELAALDRDRRAAQARGDVAEAHAILQQGLALVGAMLRRNLAPEMKTKEVGR